MKTSLALINIWFFISTSITSAQNTPLASDDFYPGYVELRGGIRLEGFISLSTWDQNPELPFLIKKKSWERKLFPKNTINFVLQKGQPSKDYRAPETVAAGQLVNGFWVKYTPYRTEFVAGTKYNEMRQIVPDLVSMPTFIESNAWMEQLEKDPAKIGYGNLVTGEIIYKNDSIRKGRIAIEEKQREFMFIDENKNLTYSPNLEKVLAFKINSEGKQQVLVRAYKQGMMADKTGWFFIKHDEFIQELEKSKTLMKGNFVLNNGQKREGRISFLRAFNAVKSYRVPLGAYFISSAPDAFIEYYNADQFDYVEQVEEGKTVRYVPLDNELLRIQTLVNTEDLLTSLETNKSKDKTKSLQTGYVIFKDGRKTEGRLAQENHALTVVGSGNKIERYHARTPELSYFIQTIDGINRKFIPLEHGLRAFEGKGFEFVEVLQPTGKYSYYVNPAPTHIRKGVTNLVTTAVNVATDIGRTTLATEAAQQQVKKEYANTEGNFQNVAGATVDAATTMQQTLELTEGLIEFSDGEGLHFKEWIIVNNQSGDQTVVYARNAEEQLNQLLSQCPRFAALEKKEGKRLTDLKNLDEAVKLLNACDR